MLLAMKDEAGSHLCNKENDFMLDNAYGEELLDELAASVMLMAQLQPAAETTNTVPSYDDKAISQVHDSSKAHEHLAKKAFKERENQYLEDIFDLEVKLSSHDQIVYKMGQSLQTIHMLGKKLNKIYDPFLKVGLGYQNPERLKKAIAAQPKMYDGDMLHSEKLIINSTDSGETLKDAEESRIKMRNKMIQINYEKINALYETFVPQQEFSTEQTYFSIPSTSNNNSKSKDVPSESPIKKCQTKVDYTERRWLSDSQNELREFFKTDVIPMSKSFYKNLKDVKEELIEEVQEMLNFFESMEQKVNEKSPTKILLQKEID
ncbi:hypothetical protein Tco_0854638 [Tanacetum coccineum]